MCSSVGTVAGGGFALQVHLYYSYAVSHERDFLHGIQLVFYTELQKTVEGVTTETHRDTSKSLKIVYSLFTMICTLFPLTILVSINDSMQRHCIPSEIM